MDLSPEEKRKIYNEEKARREAKQKIEAEETALFMKKGCKGCLVIVSIFFVIVLIASLSELDCNSKDGNQKSSFSKSDNSSNKFLEENVADRNNTIIPPDYFNRNDITQYRIIKEDESTFKLQTTSYSESISILKKEYKIIMSPQVTRDQVRSTLIQFIIDKAAQNPEIDDIMIWVYDDEIDVNEPFTMAKLNWGPKSSWQNINLKYFKENDRTNYNFNFEFRQRFSNKKLIKPTEREYKIYNEAYNELWKYPNTDEEIIFERIGRKFKISGSQAKDIYIKVMTYKQY